MPSESSQTGILFRYDFLGRSGLEAPGCDDFPFEYPSEPCRRNRILTLCGDYVSSDPRVDDVQIGQTEMIQFVCDMVEQCVRITIGHAIPPAARRDADGHAITAPHRNQCFHHLKEEAGAIFDRTALHISSPVDATLQKLIRQDAVTRVKLNAIESSGFGVLGRFAIIFDNARNFCDVERAGTRRLTPTMRRRLQYRWILPIFRVD